MKTKTFKSVMAVLGVLLSLNAHAYDVEIDGIYYNVITKANKAEVTSGDSKYTGEVTIPASIIYEDVTYLVGGIGIGAFSDCTSLTSIIIPNSVTSIGSAAFSGCTRLTSITIPNSVTSIGDYAFWYCTRLTSITIPNSVTSIGMHAFYECSRLTSITIPNSVTSIGQGTFYRCSGLTSITIPNSVTSIGSSAFEDCSGLTVVNITDLASWCNISFKDTYSAYSNPLFYAHHLYLNGEEVKDLVIPNSVTSIGNRVFSGCSGLTSITIPNSVTSIGQYAFSGCSGLTSITIPNSVTSIGYFAFQDCSGLTSITIPNSVTSIRQDAFARCSGLTSVTIPNSVTSIGSSAFYECRNIENLYCYAEKIPSTNGSAFEDAYIEYATLHVPAASIEAYKSTAPWSGFGKIVALEDDTPEEPEIPQCETPTIAYENGKMVFTSATEGAEFISDITDEDIKKHYDSKVELKAAYQISVYATATGHTNSETATATLCWIDTDPKTEDITDKIAEVAAYPVLIQSQNGQITVKGAADNTPVAIYTTAGAEVGNAISSHGTATISTNLPSGTTAIVKIGTRSVKVLVK